MDLQGALVNRVFSIKSKEDEDFFYEWWEASSIYSADPLTFKFCKFPVPLIGMDTVERLKEDFLKIFEIQTPYLLDPFEVGVYEDLFYQAFLDTGNVSLYSITSSAIEFPYEIALKIAINVFRGLLILEKKGLHHNLLTPSQIYLTETDQNITNIKITGFFDHYLLKSAGNKLPSYKKDNGRYFYLKNCSLSNMKSKAENDIYSVGVILAEMLTGNIFTSLPDVDFPKNLPGWILTTLGKMIDSPEYFASIESLYGYFVSNSPEHSILEDSIEERIEMKGSGGLVESNDIKLEELPGAEGGKDSESVQTSLEHKVKIIISKILSIFKRKKMKENQNILDQSATEESSLHQVIRSENEADTNLPESEKIEFDTAFAETRSPGIKSDNVVKGKDPWAVEKDRYKKQNDFPDISVPPTHNAGGSDDTNSPLLHLDERQYSEAESVTFEKNNPLPEEKKKQVEDSGDLSNAKKTIEMLENHRMNLEVDGSINPVKKEAVDKNPFPVEGRESIKTGQSFFNSKDDNSEMEKTQKEMQNDVRDDNGTKPEKSESGNIFKRFITWLKKHIFK